MKHLMRYSGFTPEERKDEILDKISKYGIDSISKIEKEFLDSFAVDKQDEFNQKINFLENEIVFEDDHGYFKFEFNNLEVFDGERHFIGVMYVPDLVWEDITTIVGRLEGSIVLFDNGDIIGDFYYTIDDNSYDIYEFCEGLEQELDIFLEYVVEELEKFDFLK